MKDNGYYVGMSSDPEKRLKRHNFGHVKSTKHRAAFKLIYTEKFASRDRARKREIYLKSYKGSKEKNGYNR